ncbi:MAG: hypothetical protein CFE43_20890 [Burkholderiales bacterium PBB3]|nr:MAG: hypothetical protein CFE43_20890 [Burkholderiales bacterium PBB3]
MIANFECTNQTFAGKLLAAPAAYLDESPASWIQYVCAGHQYSITRLEDILGVKPRFHDWDLRVSRLDWLEVLKRADSDHRSFAAAFLSQEYSSLTSMGKASSLLHSGPPKYRWCSACLEDDDRPYIRWWWRFPGSTYCPKHQSRLASQCGNCKSELVLSYALMVNAGRRCPIPDLGHCQSCGLPRWFTQADESVFSPPAPGHSSASTAADRNCEDDIDPLQKIKDGLKRAEKVRWGNDRFLVDDFGQFVMSSETKKRPVLLIKASVLNPERMADDKPVSKNWSSGIVKWRVPDRRKLAYALGLFRKELKSIDRMSWSSVGGKDEST